MLADVYSRQCDHQRRTTKRLEEGLLAYSEAPLVHHAPNEHSRRHNVAHVRPLKEAAQRGNRLLQAGMDRLSSLRIYDSADIYRFVSCRSLAGSYSQ